MNRKEKRSTFPQFLKTLKEPKDASSLGLFRILLGIILFIQVVHFFAIDFVSKDLVAPLLHFKFYWFSFLDPLPESGLNALLYLLCVAAILVITGYFYRIAMTVYFLGFSYLWLLDKGFFNNHYYLISLLCGMMIFLPATAWNPFRKGQSNNAPQIRRWQIDALRLQLLIVFVWAGLNKLNAGWLIQHQPIAFVLAYKAEFTQNPSWNTDWLTYTMIYGGLLFDLLIIPALWWKKTRWPALVAMVVFNCFNYWVFHDVGEIGIFPWLVLSTVVLFFEPNVGVRLFKGLRPRPNKKQKKPLQGALTPQNPVLMYFFGGFLLLQLLLPARHFLIPGHVDWTSEGQRFAWRMKIFYKDFNMHFYMVEDAGKGTRYEVNVANMLSPKQYTALGYYPDLIPPTARFLKKEALKKGLRNPAIQVEFVSGLNGYSQQALLDPQIDASKLEAHPFKRMDWVIPYSGN